MNNLIVTIILLAISLMLLVVLLKTLLPTVLEFINRLPIIVKIIFILILFAIVFYLVSSISPNIMGGMIGTQTEVKESLVEETTQAVVKEEIDNCIILREDQIWIENDQVDMEQVEKYIDEHVENNIELIIVDDYSLSSLHHKITDLCDEKGVNYKNENEEWIK